MKYFVNKLSELIKGKNMSLEKLAKDINKKSNTNISKSMLSKWRGGSENPSLINLRILAEYFNISIDEFLGIVLENKLNTIEDSELNRKFSQLTEDNKKEVIDYINFKIIFQNK